MTIEEVLQIMTYVEVVIKVLCVLLGVTVTLATTLPGFIAAIKKRKNAQTDAEKAQADLEIRAQLELLVSNAETNYATLDAAMKSLGSSAGMMKKDKVLSDLRDFCDQKGYVFEKDKLSNDIDNFVRLTKEINYETK